MPAPDLLGLHPGAVAAIVYGEPRLTHDIDVVVALRAADAPRLAAAFSGARVLRAAARGDPVGGGPGRAGTFQSHSHSDGSESRCVPGGRGPAASLGANEPFWLKSRQLAPIFSTSCLLLPPCSLLPAPSPCSVPGKYGGDHPRMSVTASATSGRCNGVRMAPGPAERTWA